ncbi:MAG: septum site-determining protein MinD [Clostridia bacterium]|nr:septum site-determining protein MinD [Clostridia bacterium]
MARKIVITSGKGGVGKTTVTANLGGALANLGERVALIDVDLGLNNLDVVMGVENKIAYDMQDILEGRCRIKQALVEDREKKNLFILPSGNLSPNSSISGQQIKLIIEGISDTFDYVLIDCPAGIDIGFHRAVSCADEAIVIATPSLTSLRDADKVITVLKSYALDSIGLVVNRARGDLMMSEKMMMPSEIESLLKTELVGVIPEEDCVFLTGGYPLFKNSDSYKAYKILAQNVHKKTKKIFDVTSKYSGFFGSIRRSIKKSI